MFNIGPLELMVLAIVGLIVVGPDRIPGLAKDAAAMIRTLRELATGARKQLRDELGPEFADLDLRNLNPRTAVQRAVFGDDVDLGRLNPRNALRDAIFGDEDVQAADPRRVIRETRYDDEGDRRDETHYESPGDSGPRGSGRSRSAEDVVPVGLSKSVDVTKSVGLSTPTGVTKPVSQPVAANGRPRPRPKPVSSGYDDAT